MSKRPPTAVQNYPRKKIKEDFKCNETSNSDNNSGQLKECPMDNINCDDSDNSSQDHLSNESSDESSDSDSSDDSDSSSDSTNSGSDSDFISKTNKIFSLEISTNEVLSEVCVVRDFLRDFLSGNSNQNIDQMKSTILEKLELLRNIRTDINLEKEDGMSLFKILSANIPYQDKKKAVKLYDEKLSADLTHSEYQETVDEINSLLSGNHIETELLRENIKEEEKRLLTAPLMHSNNFKQMIYKLDAPDNVKRILYKLASDTAGSGSDAKNKRDRLKMYLSLPYHKTASFVTDPIEIYKSLDKKLYGMSDAKEAIVSFMINRIKAPNFSSILGLCSNPGMGKTASAYALAEATGLPIKRIALGGVIDSTLLLGSNGVWLGAEPSVLLQCLREMGVSNGIILFDEVDKLADTPKGQAVQNALLQITDTLQNKEFGDMYLNDFPHDISRLFFIFSMNSTEFLIPPLKDRLHIIHIKDYTRDDFLQIIENYSLPEILKSSGLATNSIVMTKLACDSLISMVSGDGSPGGVRSINKILKTVVSKVIMYSEWIMSDISDKPSLSFNIPDFKGFPFVIKQKHVINLSGRKPLSYVNMGMYI